MGVVPYFGMGAKIARAKMQNARKLTADPRRFTRIDTERNPFMNITAEAPFDGLRVVSIVEPQRAQRIKFLFVVRRRQTKTCLS